MVKSIDVILFSDCWCKVVAVVEVETSIMLEAGGSGGGGGGGLVIQVWCSSTPPIGNGWW